MSADGFDAPTCGTKDNPSRSISQAIGLPTTSAGDRIVVGPGRYGDLDGDGVPGEAGEETPAPGCGCMLAVNRQVNVTSSHGAAATMIDARTVDVIENVLIISGGGEFGRPGKGFTVTNTATPSGDGIVNTAAGFFVTTPFTGAFEDNNVFSNGTNHHQALSTRSPIARPAAPRRSVRAGSVRGVAS